MTFAASPAATTSILVTSDSLVLHDRFVGRSSDPYREEFSEGAKDAILPNPLLDPIYKPGQCPGTSSLDRKIVMP